MNLEEFNYKKFGKQKRNSLSKEFFNLFLKKKLGEDYIILNCLNPMMERKIKDSKIFHIELKSL